MTDWLELLRSLWDEVGHDLAGLRAKLPPGLQPTALEIEAVVASAVEKFLLNWPTIRKDMRVQLLAMIATLRSTTEKDPTDLV